MSYFLRELVREAYRLPWTFILLLVVSSLTLVALTSTMILHLCHGLDPTLNIVLNAILALLWTLSFSFLAKWCSKTWTLACDTSNWESNVGVGVCRLYKTLFSFAFFGLLATLLGLGLDIRALRDTRRRGVFQQVSGLTGQEKEVTDDVRYLQSNPNPTAIRAGQVRGEEGYALPEEQFEYDGLEYHGAAGRIGRTSMEGIM